MAKDRDASHVVTPEQGLYRIIWQNMPRRNRKASLQSIFYVLNLNGIRMAVLILDSR